MSQEIINYYHAYAGSDKRLFLFSFGEYNVYLGDFEFQHENKLYKISIGGTGNCGQWFRFFVDGVYFVSNNVWNTDENALNVEQISKDDIRPTDTLLNDLKLCKDPQEVIDYYVDRINTQNSENERKEIIRKNFWKNKKVVLKCGADNGGFIYYLIKEDTDDQKSIYKLFMYSEAMLNYLHNFYDKENLRGESYNLNEIMDVVINQVYKYVPDYTLCMWFEFYNKAALDLFSEKNLYKKFQQQIKDVIKDDYRVFQEINHYFCVGKKPY